MRSFRYIFQGQLLAIATVFLVVFTACSSLQGRASSIHSGVKSLERPIRISSTVIGSSIALSPPILHIAPGEGVIWINQTSYDVRINLDSDSVSVEGLSVIPRRSTVREEFNEVGTYPYTLLFSSSKTFGKVSGEIVVEEPEPRRRPSLDVPDNEHSPEPPLVGMPEII